MIDEVVETIAVWEWIGTASNLNCMVVIRFGTGTIKLGWTHGCPCLRSKELDPLPVFLSGVTGPGNLEVNGRSVFHFDELLTRRNIKRRVY